MEPDISILRKTGHFYFALTRGMQFRLAIWDDGCCASSAVETAMGALKAPRSGQEKKETRV